MGPGGTDFDTVQAENTFSSVTDQFPVDEKKRLLGTAVDALFTADTGVDVGYDLYRWVHFLRTAPPEQGEGQLFMKTIARVGPLLQA